MSADKIKAVIELLQDEVTKMALKADKKVIERPRIGEWCRADDARLEFGIPGHLLRKLASERKVKARKFDPLEPNSAVIFKTADIRKAIESMPDYTYNTLED